MIYTIEKTKEGKWKIGNGTTWLGGFTSEIFHPKIPQTPNGRKKRIMTEQPSRDIQQAIEKAIEGGWQPHAGNFFDPEFPSEPIPKPKEVVMGVEGDYCDHSKTEMFELVFMDADEDDGYDENARLGFYIADTFLDPLFWMSLGKALGWRDKDYVDAETHAGGIVTRTYNVWTWRSEWHRFIDHLAEGKDAESFFKSLSK